MSDDGKAVRVARLNLARALRLEGRTIVLYRPSDETGHGYFGLSAIMDVHQDIKRHDTIWLELGKVTRFPQAVPLEALYGAGHTNDAPFYTYSHSVRQLSDYEAGRLLQRREFADFQGFQEAERDLLELETPMPSWTTRKARIRSRMLRIELQAVYPPCCSFTGSVYWKLGGRSCDTQVGHLIPLENHGPDIIQNALPMSSVTNWHWDHGLISLTNAGRILVASKAGDETKSTFIAGRLVHFADSRYWPKAEYLEWHRDNIFERGRRPELKWGYIS